MLVISLAAGWSTVNCIVKAIIGEGLPLEQLTVSGRPEGRVLPWARRTASWWAAFNSMMEAFLIASTLLVPWTLGRGFHLAVGFFQVTTQNVQYATLIISVFFTFMSLLHIIRHCRSSLSSSKTTSSTTTTTSGAAVVPEALAPEAASSAVPSIDNVTDVTNVTVKQEWSPRFAVEVALAFVSLVFALLVWRATGARQPVLIALSPQIVVVIGDTDGRFGDD
jgi:hypothetical protein